MCTEQLYILNLMCENYSSKFAPNCLTRKPRLFIPERRSQSEKILNLSEKSLYNSVINEVVKYSLPKKNKNMYYVIPTYGDLLFIYLLQNV